MENTMDSAQNALKVSGKVIAVIMKIGYIAMIVAVCFCVVSMIFVAVTGGKTEVAAEGGVNIRVIDAEGASPEETMATCAVYGVMSAFLLAIFMQASKMFAQIAKTGDPFEKKYGKTVRVIGILVAATTIGTGLADTIASLIVKTSSMQAYTEAPGLVVGAIIFCLSYVIDYGCALKAQNTQVK